MPAQDLLAPIVEAAPVALIVVADQGNIAFVNQEAERLFGYARAELMGRRVEILVPERLRTTHEIRHKAYFAKPATRSMGSGRELYARRRDGAEFPVEVALKPLETGGRLFVLTVVLDITERKRLEAALRQASEELEQRVQQRTAELARTNREKEALLTDLRAQRLELERLSREDALTRLANRRAFDERIEEEIRRARRYGTPLATAMLDLDHFKLVNDRYGHALGDAVLHEAADLMRQECRTIDIVARYGGEEFALALPGSDLRAGVILCDRIRQAFERFDWGRLAAGLKVTVSAGVSAWAPGLLAPDLLVAADERLYEAKRNGRNRVLPDLRETASSTRATGP